MKPVDQTLFGGEGSPREEVGNCFAACVASILEVPLATLPNFCAEWSDPDWFVKANAWLHANAGAWMISFGCADIPADSSPWLPDGALVILTGMAERGHRHCVVGRNGMIVHDPFPSRAGLRTREMLDVIVVSEPERLGRLRRAVLPPTEGEARS